MVEALYVHKRAARLAQYILDEKHPDTLTQSTRWLFARTSELLEWWREQRTGRVVARRLTGRVVVPLQRLH
jgi:hypothetical protein